LAKSPTYSGVSDDSQPVNVVVCAWNTAASQCGDVVAAFSRVSGTGSEVVRYDAAEQRYLVNWHTDRCLTGPCTLDPATTYRIRVLSGVLELGFVDIKVAATGGQAKKLDNGDYISLVNGRTLPVAFRVEQGAVSVVPRGQSSTIGTTGGNVSTFDGDVSLAIPGGAVASPVDITVETATDTPPAGEWSTPVDLGPDGATLAAPVKLTLRFDPTKLPQGVPAEALAIYTEVDGGWAEVPGSTVNANDNTVTAPISHFSVYWVGIRPNTVVGVPSPTTMFVGQSATFTSMANAYVVIPQTYCYWYASPVQSFWGTYYQYSQYCYTVTITYYYYPLGYRVTWTSSNPAVASVGAPGYSVTDANGVATSPPIGASALGTTSVSATVDGATSSAIGVSVVTKPVINPIPQGATQLLVRAIPGGTGSDTAQVLNAGDYPLQNLAVQFPPRNCYTGEPYTWLAASWDSTTAPANITLTASPPTGTPLGVYDMCFTLTGDFANPRPWGARVSVQQIVVPNAPSIDPLPQGNTQNQMTVRAGEQTFKAVPIYNSGGGTLSGLTFVGPVRNCYTGEVITWLTHSWPSTTAPTTLDLTAAPPSTTAPGTYDLCFEIQARAVGAMDRAYGARVFVQPPPPGLNLVSLGGSDTHTCGMTPAGKAYCWGQNVYGQLGTGVAPGSNMTRPTAVTGGYTFAQIAAGSIGTCALDGDGAAYCWGSNNVNSLGDGLQPNVEPYRGYPAPVLTNLRFQQIVYRGGTPCALDLTGKAWCWGWDDNDRLGNGSGPGAVGSSSIPVAVVGNRTYKFLASGQIATCGVTTSDETYCWGVYLGSNSPVAVGHAFTALSMGSEFVCGLDVAADAWCWGWNGEGQFGNGTVVAASNFTPVHAAPGLKFVQIATSQRGACGLTSGGTVYCWGVNDRGQLGNGTFTPSASPVPVSGGLTFTSIGYGFFGYCAKAIDAATYCWGENFHGQLGDGTQANVRNVPTRVIDPLP
jgi:alpha-tubulin suppressor-like RCC1 family protein